MLKAQGSQNVFISLNSSNSRFYLKKKIPTTRLLFGCQPKSSQNYHDDFTLKSVEKKCVLLYQNLIKNGSKSSLGPKEV